MNFQQIEYVLSVGKYLSFGQAAEECFITQSTISTMIGRLEDELGIKIFDRKTKPVTITKEGEVIISQLKIIAKEVARLKEITDTLKGEMSGELRIGVIPTVAPYLLPPFLGAFASKFPKITFHISELTTARIVKGIEQRTLDVGLVSIPLDEPHLLETVLYHEPFVLYDRRAENCTNFCEIDGIDLKRLWLLEEGHCLRKQVEAICDLSNREKQQNNLEYKSGAIDTLLKFVRKSDGITLLPYLATLDLADIDKKHLINFSSPVPSRTIGLVVHQHFVKKKILTHLQCEIQTTILPLLREVADAQVRIFRPT